MNEIISKQDSISEEKEPGETSRRNFFMMGLGVFATFWVAVTMGIIRFLFPKVLFEPPMSFKAGKPEDYQVGEVSERLKEKYGVWIVREKKGIYALIATCTHLGCTPNWFNDEKLFKCPCHGSNFNIPGEVVGGPAPEPLFRASIELDSFGQIVVNKAVKANRKEAREKEKFLLHV